MVTVSDTAFAISVVRADESRRPAAERLFEDPYAALFQSGPEVREATQRFLDLPFLHDNVRLRTRFHDDSVRESLANGITQVVLLGAGFDARGLRMPEIPAHGATVYEVDFAEQLERKRAILAAAGVTLPAWVAYVPCDLAAPDFAGALTAGLEARGFRVGAGAHFVWEGVMPYIGDDAIGRCLDFMARAGGRGTRAAFEYWEGHFDPVPIEERTRRAGFSRWEVTAFDALWRRLLPGEPHPNARAFRAGVAVV